MNSYNDDDDNNNSADAIVMKHSIEDQSGVLSVRFLPLQKDDDYFYYHGDGGKEGGEDDETVDHIGMLIGPAAGQQPTISIADMEQEPDSSMRSITSEVTTEWNDYDSDSQDELHYTTQDCVEMKLQIADLKAQLDSQKLHYREEYNSIISSLRDRNLSLECENVGLKQKLQDSQDLALREREDAHQVERLLQDKIELMAKEIEFLSQGRRHSKRRSSSGDAEECLSNHREEAYLPFPQSRNATKRKSSSFNSDVREISPSSLQKISVGHKPSLLATLCQPFRKGSSSNDSNTVPTTASSQVSSLNSDESDKLSHYSWANADEINAQTGLLNKKKIAKLLEDSAKNGCPNFYEPVRNRSSQPKPTSPRPQRRTSFTLGESLTLGERRPSLKDFLMGSGEEDSIDVERELWDNDDDALDASGRSNNYPSSVCHSIRTAGW